jgi:hypothetical protein
LLAGFERPLTGRFIRGPASPSGATLSKGNATIEDVGGTAGDDVICEMCFGEVQFGKCTVGDAAPCPVCGGYSSFAPFNADWGLCCHRGSEHRLETVFEHFTCPAFINKGWGPHNFTDDPEFNCQCGGVPSDENGGEP